MVVNRKSIMNKSVADKGQAALGAVDKFNGCPHCRNRVGFVFGTCIECGFNHLDHSFHFITAQVHDLPPESAAMLIAIHARRTRNSRQDRSIADTSRVRK